MTDLTSLVSADGGITWEVPEGSWKMMAFFRSHTGQMVKRATVGSEGRVLDHFSLEALQKHIDWVGEAFRGAVGPAFGKTVRAMFCDSWEVFGSDWTPAFPEEFRKRRGYDLGPYLPALWNDIGPKTPLVRFDYWQTLSELSLEKFFEPFAAWCADNGLKARVQAHGTPSDVLRSYGVSQIPEGEGSGPHVIISVLRQAASATRLYGREICSAEAFTWLQRPRYIVTMEQIKASADTFFQDGINHIVHHGYSYSPPSVGVPGWVFYASILANHNNTWWKYYRPLSDYMGRISYALRQGHFVADLCVYLPYNDTWGHWRKGAFPTLHLSSEVEKWMGLEVPMAIRRGGYDFDLINDDILINAAEVVDGTMVVRNQRYSVLVLPNLFSIPSPAIVRIREFAAAGGIVIATRRLPDRSPSLRDFEGESRKIRKTVNDLFGEGGPESVVQVHPIGKGFAYLVPDEGTMIEVLAQHVDPDLYLPKHDPDLYHIHRQDGERDIYFISNQGDQPKKVTASFRVEGKIPEAWEPLTGDVEPISLYFHQGDRTCVPLELPAFGSQLLVFGPPNGKPHATDTNTRKVLDVKTGEAKARVGPGGKYFIQTDSGVLWTKAPALPPTVEIERPWRLSFEDNGESLEVVELGSWTDYPEARTYSGSGTYSASFSLSEAYMSDGLILFLDLGRVHEIAEVFVNERPAGVSWMAPRRLAITDLVQPGKNSLRIVVTNLLINKVLGDPDPDYEALVNRYGPIRFPYPGEKKEGALSSALEKADPWQTGLRHETHRPFPSGLFGPVKIDPNRIVTFKK